MCPVHVKIPSVEGCCSFQISELHSTTALSYWPVDGWANTEREVAQDHCDIADKWAHIKEVPKSVGQSGSTRFSFNRSVAGLQSRIPLLKFPPQGAVKSSRPGLQHEMRAAFRPPHLLTFAKALADNCVGLRSSSVGREIIGALSSDYLRMKFPFGSQ